MYKLNLKKCYVLTVGILLLASAQAEEVEAMATIAFHGTSTLHGFEGTVDTAPFTATFRKDDETGQLYVSATATVSVLDMTTHHKKRDKNMFKMLNPQDFSLITGVLANAPLPEEGSSEVILHLKIHDVEQEVPATLSDWKREGDLGSCRMVFSVSLKAFGLKAPSVMGLIRVGDIVNVECILKGTNP